MSISALTSTPVATSSSASSNPGRTELTERIGRADVTPAGGGSSTLQNIVEGVAAGVSATVAFSGEALHALEQTGEYVVDGAENLAVGAWHGIENAAVGVEHAGEAIVDSVETDVQDVVAATKSAAKELGHYAAVGMQAVGEAASEVASGTVMAASAVGKTVAALV